MVSVNQTSPRQESVLLSAPRADRGRNPSRCVVASTRVPASSHSLWYGDHVIGGRPIWVTIPTVGYSPLLVPLINALEQDRAVDKIILTINLEEFVDPIKDFFRFGPPEIEILETWPQGRSIYHGWNTAIEMAKEDDAHLAVLNDDIRLLTPNAISHVAGLLTDSPSYAIAGLNWMESPESIKPGARPLRQVHGSYRHHGVGGFAWVCDPHKIVQVPKDFTWWYGDDHIFMSAEKDGHSIGIATNVPVEHVNELTASEHDWAQEAKGHDHKAFARIWPEG